MEENYSLDALKTKSNEELMRLAQNNIKGAYDIIYDRLFEKFANIALKILRNRADAEDAAQQALITGHIKRGKFLYLSKVETWLTRILINKAKDIIRKNGGIRRPEHEETEDEAESQEETKAGESLDPDIDKRAREGNYQLDRKTRLMLMFLGECIKKLPEEERVSLELKEIYEMGYKETVKILNERFGHSSLGNIKNKTDSAKKKLKNCLEDQIALHRIIFEK